MGVVIANLSEVCPASLSLAYCGQCVPNNNARPTCPEGVLLCLSEGDHLLMTSCQAMSGSASGRGLAEMHRIRPLSSSRAATL